jgi:hypothetical protein
MKSFSTGCIATLSIALLAVACGGAKVSESAFDEPVDGGATADTAVGQTDAPIPNETGNPKKDSGGGPEDAPAIDTAPPLSAENLCTRLADSICTSALSGCCATKGFEWKEAGCRTAVMTDCANKKDAVKKGDTTLNLDAYGACVAAWSALSTKCSVPVFEFVKSYPPCNQLFNGTTPFGDSCGEDYECKVAAGAYGNCSTDNRCDSVIIAANGAPCGGLPGTRAFCDYGLQCMYSSSTSGTCRPAKAIGAMCTQNFECGFGNWCNRGGFGSSGSCVAGSAVGAACSFDAQCASGDCNSSGRCTDPNVTVASPIFCNGSGG